MFTVCCLLVIWFEQVSWKMEIERWKGKDEKRKMEHTQKWKMEEGTCRTKDGTWIRNKWSTKDEGWRMKDEGCTMQGWFDFWVLYRSNIQNIWTITYFWFIILTGDCRWLTLFFGVHAYTTARTSIIMEPEPSNQVYIHIYMSHLQWCVM